MSRIGNQLITIPEGVEVALGNHILTVKGSKGQLILKVPSEIKGGFNGKELSFKNKSDLPKVKALHGLIRSLAQNATIGVSKGWNKTLQLVGVGFRAQTDGKKLTLIVGFSHPVEFEGPEGITFTISGNDVTVSGIDKQLVGETAARIRRIKPPEVYKGKGIRYKDEVIHLKPGKAAKTAGVGVGAK